MHGHLSCKYLSKSFKDNVFYQVNTQRRNVLLYGANEYTSPIRGKSDHDLQNGISSKKLAMDKGWFDSHRRCESRAVIYYLLVYQSVGRAKDVFTKRRSMFVG